MEIKIALAGNPNCGKTTLFNNLTGSNQYVGNWPGVTVEKKEGRLKEHKDVIIQDLPGIYSLSPYTLEEVVTRNYIVNEKPDAVLNIVDGTNIERNLYLTTQLIEIGIPVVIAINMMDLVRKNGDNIDIKKLGQELGCKVVEISALKNEHTMEAAELCIAAAKEGKKEELPHVFTGSVEHALAHIEESIQNVVDRQELRWYAIKIFERDSKALEQLKLDPSLLQHMEEHIKDCEKEMDDDAESIITNQRYTYITDLIHKTVKKGKQPGALTTSDKIDRIVTNRWLALPIFAAVMFIVYYVSVSTLGGIVTDWTNDTLFGTWIQPGVETLLTNAGASDWLISLVVDGIIGGLAAPIGFVPQMAIVFLFLSFLEDVGYMARVAFIMDRIFRRFGLSGKSFIPFLISSGCGVPGIMATRTIESEKDRRMTMITTTMIPCGAKLPIIALIASALFHNAWWVAPSAYFVGIFAIIVSGIMLKKTKMFAGDPAPFVMELPAYHLPTISNLLRSMWERASAFIKKAGTIILLSSIIIWAGSVFGFVDGAFGFDPDMELESSILGIIGDAICWIFSPLGFGNIKATIATIMGLVAKEEVVGVFGVLDFEGMSQLAAYSFLVFNLLCAPCFAAIGAIKREMNSAKWTWFAIGYQCGFAYCMSLVIYQIGSAFTGNLNVIGLIAALAVVAVMVYMLFKPYKESNKLTLSVNAK